MCKHKDNAYQSHQATCNVDETFAPEAIREPASDKGGDEAGEGDQDNEIGGGLLRMCHANGIAHIVLQERLDGIDTQHHDQGRDENPGEIGVAPGVEVEQAQNAHGDNELENDLLDSAANLNTRQVQTIPESHNTQGYQ